MFLNHFDDRLSFFLSFLSSFHTTYTSRPPSSVWLCNCVVWTGVRVYVCTRGRSAHGWEGKCTHKEHKHPPKLRRSLAHLLFHPRYTTPFNMPPKFNAASSSVSAETIQTFLEQQACDISIKDVPGVGAALCSGFQEQGITTCAQLLAKFLTFCDDGADAEDVCQSFFSWVKSVNSHANAHNVTFAIANYADTKGLFKYEN